MKEIEIRSARRTDAAQLAELIQESYDDAADALWFAERPSPETLDALLAVKFSLLERNEVIDNIAALNGEVVADCEIIKEGREGLLGMLVRRRYRSNGVGRALLVRSLRDARLLGLRRIRAEVAPENSGAMRFFLKNGFALTGAATETAERNGKQATVVKLVFDF